jgi:tryptophan halogenase
MGLEDDSWMPKCNATYKTSIAFKNFREGKGERFQYPFGKFDTDSEYCDNPIRFYELRAKYGKELYPPEEFARFVNKSTILAEDCRIADSIPGSRYDTMWDRAYHLDAELFGQYLREEHAIPNGVVHIKGDVGDVVKRPDGSIKSIIISDGTTISADLFIDCTGFKSLLLEQHMNVPFKPFEHKLFNDSALATQIPYVDREKQMETYTDCVGMNAGWVWNIPLWHRVGTGYCYSSKYINQCEAEVEFRKYLAVRYSPKIAHEAEFKPIKIKHGKHTEAWVKNVVGIGLSYGFVEPLESTGLMTTHENILLLSDFLERREGIVTRFDRDSYNGQVNNMIEAMSNFVSLHYSLSSREDNQYWRDVTENIDYVNMGKHLYSEVDALANTWLLMNSVENTFAKEHDEQAGSIYICAGHDYIPYGKSSYGEKVRGGFHTGGYDIEEAHQQYQKDRAAMIEWSRRQPTHYEYLRDNIYNV